MCNPFVLGETDTMAPFAECRLTLTGSAQALSGRNTASASDMHTRRISTCLLPTSQGTFAVLTRPLSAPAHASDLVPSATCRFVILERKPLQCACQPEKRASGEKHERRFTRTRRRLRRNRRDAGGHGRVPERQCRCRRRGNDQRGHNYHRYLHFPTRCPSVPSVFVLPHG
jgi:hypothetical protein